MRHVRAAAYHRYELSPVTRGAARREGALLRFTFEDGAQGYADCHPWPELGDQPLDAQLHSIPTRAWTAVTGQSLLCAFLDADSRRHRRSLFAGLTVPPSHYSLPNASRMQSAELSADLFRAEQRGFSRVKVKAGDRPDTDVAWLATVGDACRALRMRARIDLNAKLPFNQVGNFLRRLSVATSGLEWVDWIEDPCRYDVAEWTDLGSKFEVRLAADRVPAHAWWSDNWGAGVLVYKAAAQSTIDFRDTARRSRLPVCYTSYLDHPLGQTFAAYAAASNAVEAASVETCGLLTHTVYEPNAFSERLGTHGPVLVPPQGTGLGFDDLLEALDWQPLA